MNYLLDYHVHSIHSYDGVDAITDICRSAVKKGIREIIITDHYEPDMGDEYYWSNEQQCYHAEMLKAKEAFAGRLNVKLGVELAQPHLHQKSTKSILENLRYDYVIGSVHKLSEGTDVEEIDYTSIREEDICGTYLKQIKMLIEWNDFDCIGHLDLIKRYSAGVYRKNLSLTCQYELLEEVLKAAIASGKGIEINTSGLRQTPKETMPGPDVLSLYRRLGGEILTIGSDAHTAEDLGKGVTDAIELAREAGFKFITLFNGRKPEWISISDKKNAYSSAR